MNIKIVLGLLAVLAIGAYLLSVEPSGSPLQVGSGDAITDDLINNAASESAIIEEDGEASLFDNDSQILNEYANVYDENEL